ncbi:ABC transporter permease [Microbacterium hydrocarbonoxydans]|uniref:ABC transporter permease n=1 Tax=Microbacterium hydrocarbonoxydans TaxID=273678 RepID=UPI00204024FE|nr:ABC transporter permease [Microbacterium hydrocarbonoxydans]MCM3779987.1 ABC transporter permease [Microbacterium hydrocarbonoxydans]
MRNVVRSEILRSVSGLSVSAVYIVAVLMPVFVLFSDGTRWELAGLDAGTATTRLLEPLAWCGVSAAFVGAYAVTRECYYGSLGRTLTSVALSRAFWGKIIGGAVVGVAMVFGILVVWTLGASLVLARAGLSLSWEPDTWRLYAGALLGAVLGAPIGAAVGWIVRNYYAAAALLIVIPLALEFTLLRVAPEVARFSPGLALAALGVPGHQDRMLEFVPALAVGLTWLTGLTAAAWLVSARRRP